MSDEEKLRLCLGEKDKELEKIKIFNWDFIKGVLEEKKMEIEKIFKEKWEKTKKLIEEEFLVKKFPNEVYIFLSYSFFGHCGSPMKEKPAILYCVNEDTERESVFEVIVHELLHKLFKINNLSKIWIEELKEDASKFEEALLDYFVPRGLFSIKLGFCKKFREPLKERYEWYKEYYEKLRVLKEYDFSESIWEFLLKRIENERIRRVCKRVLELPYEKIEN